MLKITFSIKDFCGCCEGYIPILPASIEILYGKCYFNHI
jgi:hypothetical protein